MEGRNYNVKNRTLPLDVLHLWKYLYSKYTKGREVIVPSVLNLTPRSSLCLGPVTSIYVFSYLNFTGRDFSHDETLDVPTQVELLIKQATSHENLCQCYIGWWVCHLANLAKTFSEMNNKSREQPTKIPLLVYLVMCWSLLTCCICSSKICKLMTDIP